MDGTLFVARAQNQFSGGHAIYFCVRSAPMIVAPTSHPWRTHLPSIRHALLHQRYAISAPHVRYGKDKGFMGGTLFALAKRILTVQLSRSLFTKCVEGEFSEVRAAFPRVPSCLHNGKDSPLH